MRKGAAELCTCAVLAFSICGSIHSWKDYLFGAITSLFVAGFPPNNSMFQNHANVHSQIVNINIHVQ